MACKAIKTQHLEPTQNKSKTFKEKPDFKGLKSKSVK